MMEVILLEKVQNLGDLGETVKVANGYARNFLIPRRKAVRATEEAKAQVEERRRQLALQESKRLEVAQARADLSVREITVTRLALETGDLYGSVSPADIAEALVAAGTYVEKSEIIQPDGPIKRIGQFEAEVILHPEVRFTVQVHVLEGESNAPGGLADAGVADAPEAADAADAPEAAEAEGAEAPDAPDAAGIDQAEPGRDRE
ncbi:MAG: 50S ribosomal protein L9 [Gammaproteobacteria bacterium]|nr:50S ribosomal protein L9 [Gammaproteobacteria bacterium]